MAEARKTQLKHMQGSAMALLMHPSSGLREDIVRQGGTPKNHAKDNYLKIKEIQKKNRLKQELDQQEKPAVFHLKQFSQVGSKVNSRPTTPQSTNSSEEIKKNFIKLNMEKAKQGKKIEKTETKPASHHHLGAIPQYLIDRKLEWAQQEEERLRKLEEAQIPPGTVLVPEDERVETLAYLNNAKQDLIREISAFPIRITTLKMKQRKDELETKLQEMERAIELFSNPKVYVLKEQDPMNELSLAA